MDYGVVTQELLDHLQEMDKFFRDNNIKFAALGSKKKYEIHTFAKHCTFAYDINRTGTLENKITLQIRYNRTNTMIIRLDINGPEHTNPDGSTTERDHVHITREADGVLSEWGYSLTNFKEILISDTTNLFEIFDSFCNHNKISLDTVNIQESV